MGTELEELTTRQDLTIRQEWPIDERWPRGNLLYELNFLIESSMGDYISSLIGQGHYRHIDLGYTNKIPKLAQQAEAGLYGQNAHVSVIAETITFEETCFNIFDVIHSIGKHGYRSATICEMLVFGIQHRTCICGNSIKLPQVVKLPRSNNLNFLSIGSCLGPSLNMDNVECNFLNSYRDRCQFLVVYDPDRANPSHSVEGNKYEDGGEWIPTPSKLFLGWEL